ncbi:MAG: hypothetical protein JXQ72_17220 [Anaerolineae bacterium]|nr:hypothetical protein [Anaerolineae bacterium]
MAAQTDNPPRQIPIAGVRFFEIGKLYHFSHAHLPDLQVGEFVIVETTRGQQMGQVMNLLDGGADGHPRDYKPILRKATPQDLMQQKNWQTREPEALITCREKAAELGGFENAKFVAAQYNYNGTLLTFLFSAEDKLHTTKLRSAIQRSFKAKVELRQVGPRDVAKSLGGMGACGITRCCSTFLTDFSPISIKMAKAQGISLNPSEITGMCGRLRCCLLYEYEQYVQARKELPKRNKRVGTPLGEGKVIDVHPLQDAVSVLIEDTRHLVQREDLIPMEEWEAFKAAAAADAAAEAEIEAQAEADTEAEIERRRTTRQSYSRPPRSSAPRSSAPPSDDAAERPDQEKDDSASPSSRGDQSSQRRGRGGRRRGRSRRSKRRSTPDQGNQSNQSKRDDSSI